MTRANRKKATNILILILVCLVSCTNQLPGRTFGTCYMYRGASNWDFLLCFSSVEQRIVAVTLPTYAANSLNGQQSG